MKTLTRYACSLLAICLIYSSSIRTLQAKDDIEADEENHTPVVVSDEAQRIHDSAILVDGHNDLPWELRTKGSLSFERLDISQPQPRLQTDIPRLKKGGLGAQFWSVYVPVDTALRGTSLAMTLEQINLVKAMCERYPDVFQRADTVAEIRRAHKNGKIASMIGVEGGHSIENSLSVLQQLYKLGARYMTLTHSKSTPWADSCTGEAISGGLSPFGEDIVAEMNRLGMLVDLSHVSADTMKDALRVTKAPVIFSHSSARAVANHPRNVPDDVLKLVAKNGGVVMVNFYSSFVVPESAARDVRRYAYRDQLNEKLDDQKEIDAKMRAWEASHPIKRGTIYNVVDHIDHIVEVAGIDCVGIGSDYDGVPVLPEQLEDVSCYPKITQVLLDRGYNEEQIHKILGENALRVMQRAEEVAAELQASKKQ